MAEKGGTKILAIITICIILISIGISGCVEDGEYWGEDGELSLEILLDKTVISSNESIQLTYTLTNIGKTDLRIWYPLGPPLKVFDSENNTYTWSPKFSCEPPPPRTNDDLEILHSKESVSFDFPIDVESWNLKRNESYRVIGLYKCGEMKNDDVTLPYWKGEIWSNELYFIVTD